MLQRISPYELKKLIPFTEEAGHEKAKWPLEAFAHAYINGGSNNELLKYCRMILSQVQSEEQG